ncbi:MAG: GNAT family N-acetyltransferase [Chloroflexi bacterium]|nr:GNAT family N-acetyltransferase [Chloroflexota bacterium]
MRINLFRPKTKPFLERVIIRTLVKRDLKALEWDGEFAHFRHLYADSYERMLRGQNLMWVAELPGTGIIGQVFIQLNCSQPELADGHTRAYFFSFRVQPAFRNLGLGTLIIKTVENDLRQRGYSILTLNVAKDNPRARKLYERHGFKVTGQEPGVWSYIDHQGFWRHVNEPAWRMEKKL